MRVYAQSALLLFLLAAAVPTAPAAAAGQRVSILGCVNQGVEHGCLVITDRKTGKTYQINAAEPKPDPAQQLVVALQAQINEGAVDFCQQGPILTAIKWSYTKTRCTPAR
jgi:hypothetical protein